MRSTLRGQQADAARFQDWIRRRQYPASCGATNGAVTRQDYFYVLGLGAQMVSLKFNFVYALLQGMVYHFPTSHYTNPLRCPFGCGARHGRGICAAGVCMCALGWSGMACQRPLSAAVVASGAPPLVDEA